MTVRPSGAEVNASGSVTIGAAVGGSPDLNGILFINAAGQLDTDPELKYDPSFIKLGPAGNNAWIRRSGTNILELSTNDGASSVTLGATGRLTIVNADLSLTASSSDNRIDVPGTNRLGFRTAGTSRWEISAAGHLIAATDATFDIGQSGATRPRDGFFSRNLFLGGTLSIGSIAVPLQTRGAPTRFTLEAPSGALVGIQGNLAAATAGTTADIILGADATRSAGWILRMDNSMASGDAGTRLWGLKFDARMFIGVPNSAPTDADLQVSEATAYLDQTANSLLFRVKYSDGTLKTGTVALT